MIALRPSRRNFLVLGAALAATSSVARAATPSDLGPGLRRTRKLKLGVASYSLRKFSLADVIAMCGEMGATNLTLKDVHMARTDPPEALVAAWRKIDAAGLTVMGGGVISMKNDAAQVRKDFEYAKSAGMPTIVASPEPDALALVERMIQEYGIPVAIHNHGPEDKFYPAPQDVLRVIKNRDRRLGICMDIGHAARTGIDPVQAVFDCRDRILDVHVKDLAEPRRRKSHKRRWARGFSTSRAFSGLS